MAGRQPREAIGRDGGTVREGLTIVPDELWKQGQGVGLDRLFVVLRAEGRRVWLTVADNGDGIPPQLLGVLFDGYLPLGAVEASDRSRHMGIGLSVCRAIVRAHGGEIYARNKIDGGAEFRFWLPAEEESNT